MVEILHTSGDVMATVRRIFESTRQRRVAIVAFVGKGAAAYLPNPKGLELYCWPKPGSTSAEAVHELQDCGVNVLFADRVHMKVYWAERSGAVITSANLSDNALGVGGLYEAGVFVPASKVDINKLIKSIKPFKVKEPLLESLAQAEANQIGMAGYAPNRPDRLPTFMEWHSNERKPRWKWGYFNTYSTSEIISRRAKAAVAKLGPTCKPVEVVSCRRSQYQAGDWILHVRLSPNGLLTTPQWVYTHLTVSVEKKDRVYNESYKFQAVQAHELRHCPSPPFKIDSAFKQALRKASKQIDPEEAFIQVDGNPPTAKFLNAIKKHFNQAS